MIAEDDPVAQRLRAAVWADPDSDDVRMVYADYLLQQGDELGELIALQLERARTGSMASSREWDLVNALDRRPAGPLGMYLSMFSLERGFVSTAMPIPNLSPEIAHHPAWSTVERLEIESSDTLLTSPHLRARTLAGVETALDALSYGARPLPFSSLGAINPTWGLSFRPEQRGVFEHLGAFDRIRALSLNARGLEDLDPDPPVLESRLCRQLEHLDLTFTSVRVDDLEMWLRWLATSQLQRITFQIPLAADPVRRKLPYPSHASHYTCFAVDRSVERLIIQIQQPTEARHLDSLLRAASVLGAATGRTSVEVHDLGDSNQIEVRQALVLEGLRDVFTNVQWRTGAMIRLAI